MMDRRERKRRLIVFLTFLLNCLSVGLLSSALGTDFWITSRLRDINSELSNNHSLTSNNDDNATHQPLTLKHRPGGHINFGLFHGFVRHNKGLGDRQSQLTTFCQANSCSHFLLFLDDLPTTSRNNYDANHDNLSIASEDFLIAAPLLFTDLCPTNALEDPSIMLDGAHLFNRGLWLATILFVTSAIITSVIAAIYALLNTTYTPVAVFNGIAGLYLWNTIGIVVTLLGVLMWLVLFYSTFQYNVLPPQLLYPIPKFSTCGIAELGYSFWFVLASMLIFAMNIVLLTLRDWQIRTPSLAKHKPTSSTNDNLFMY